MSRNLGYVRFSNTYDALVDCYEHIDDDDLSEEEAKYRAKLIRLCQVIADEVGEEEE